jgi:zinc protease
MNQPARPAVLAVLATAFLALAALGAAQSPPKWPSISAPRPLAAHEVKFPPYEIRTLPNGLQVVVVMHHEQPAVSLRLIVRAGGAHDPAGKPGVAALLTSVLDQGTTTKTAQDVADTIDSAGGQLDTGIGRDLSWAHVVVMKDSLPLGMNLLADVVRRPAFAEEEVARQRKQTLSALQVSHQDPEYLANVVFERLVYGFNPYGLPGNGTAESVQRITRDDLMAFHRTHFAPNNCLLAVVGDVTVDEAIEVVTRAFGDWERHDVPAFTPTDPPEATRRVVVVDKPDSVQTEIRVGHLGIARKTTDYMPVDLAIKILGGEGANRLHRVLRTERGLTYGVSADTQTLKRSGMFVAKTNTRSDATAEVLRLIVDEYSRLRRERVNDDELSDAKAYLAGHFPLTIETPDEIATQVLNALFYELPLDELQTYRQRVNAVSVDDVARAAWKYVRPDRLAVVLVGNASAFADQLRGVGFGKYELVRLSELDLSTADFKRKDVAKPSSVRLSRGGAPWPVGLRDPIRARVPASAALGASPGSPVSRDQARPDSPADAAEALVARAIAAKGGLETLQSVRTVQATATTTLMTPQGPARTQTTTYIAYPDRFRVEAHVATGTVIQVYAGENEVWVQDPVKGLIDVPPQARRDFKAGVDRDLIPLLLRAARHELKLRLIDQEAVGDAKVRAVELSAQGLEPVTIYIDTETGLVVRETYRLPGGGGTAEELFSDYRDVGRLKVAFLASVRRNGLPVLERAVTQFTLNPPLKPGLFDKPAPGKPRAPAGEPVTPNAPDATEALAAQKPQSAPGGLAAPKPQSETGALATPKPHSARGGLAAPKPQGSSPGALALIDLAIKAKGGIERLKAVRSMRIDSENTAITPQGKQKADSVSYL